MSKLANAHPMTSFRTSLWARLFLAAIHLARGKLSRDKIDRLFYDELGLRSSRERPRMFESLLDGRDLSSEVRKCTVEDCVRAGSRILKNSRLERLFFSPVWLLAIPESRTLEVTTNAINRILQNSGLERLSAEESLQVVRCIPDRSDGLSGERVRYIARVHRYSELLLAEWRKRRLVTRDELAVLRVLSKRPVWALS